MNLFAYTEVPGSMPGYLSINRLPTGEIAVTLRASPTSREGVHICAYGRDAGPGWCTPGGNYCNMAPEKGPMQDKPMAGTHTVAGVQASLTLPADQWAKLTGGG